MGTRAPRPRARSLAPSTLGVTSVVLTILLGALVLAVALFSGMGTRGGAQGGGPSASRFTALGPVPGWTSPVIVVTASPISGAQPSPTRLVTPSVAPSATPAPRQTVTPRARPSGTPKAAPPVVAPGSGTPAQSVAAFYAAVASHDWQAAISLWSPDMQRRYPPQEWLIDRFAHTTRIVITRLRTLSRNDAGGTASVAVSLVEYRTVAPSPRTFVGSWDLVRLGGRWLLDQPHF